MASKKHDYYAILEINATATTKEVTKAYRTKALQYHPDKNPDNPEAVEMFHLVNKAFNVLSDEKQRAVIDAELNAKEARKKKEAEMDAGRRKMKDALVAREQAAKRGREEHEFSKKKLEEEIAALRTGFKKRKDKWATPGVHVDESELEADAPFIPKPQDPKATENAVKVKWNKKKAYTKDEIHRIFSRFGRVEVVILVDARPGSGVSPSALISFIDPVAVQAAVISTSHDPEMAEFKVSRMTKGTTPATHTSSPTRTSTPTPTTTTTTPPSIPPSCAKPADMPFAKFEADVLSRMRSAAQIRRQQRPPHIEV
eukprot:TRINITY_DN5667_c0_g1_i1.p1 TRINITY_DN5667_c0_g1~~TRINITY_DN5667_c0_g1_i1.p1  ORF type:complete len:313 (-),score=83.93 TRINITY_DN5667_c0_g1_i1:148-1086(-)